MNLPLVVLCLTLGAYASGSDWCYTGCDHTPSHWKDIAGSFCGSSRQSPINIHTLHVEKDANLKNFSFKNFSSPHVFKTIQNNGHTVKCTIENVEVGGGGLPATYTTLQLHFHWGDTEHHPGSEHLIDGHRYAMEMHIVSLKKGQTADQAVADSEGIAVLGFFINATEDGVKSEPWGNLTSYLNVSGTEMNMTDGISINDLIGSVNLTKFYRYMGSLTTPNCNEAVVWTVFHEPINVHKDLVQQFASKTGLKNVYRPEQKLSGRRVYASPATPLPPSPSWCYDDHCGFGPSQWHLLPQSKCAGKHQSPINIEEKNTEVDDRLGPFTFVKFDDKHAIKYMINTGHTVKCVLKEDLLELSSGGLDHTYSVLQLHLHWGSDSRGSTGSEHTVESIRYPMEMHIVSKRKDLTLDKALLTHNGLAVLGFLIAGKTSHKFHKSVAAASHGTSGSSTSDAWKKLSNYLSSIKNTSSQVTITEEISIDDLLGNVDRTSYYRYNGSLTTPSCNQAVVWTVFKEPIEIDQDLIMKFPISAGYHDVFRPTQPLNGRKIYTTSGASTLELSVFMLVLGFFFAFA
ncbi:uncharacterized protein LOC128759109 [Synchiropus splendidus]|uniref:uncharacterized protein LOC128759109 n=1 Tax=Synchiropus splendidus TaxID=270530 RepID=UPI00237DD5D1|nr:uncharacterized protein LOC128759109 [Synchiropus splendidus]